jgi:hypothetical protein
VLRSLRAIDYKPSEQFWVVGQTPKPIDKRFSVFGFKQQANVFPIHNARGLTLNTVQHRNSHAHAVK